MGFTKEARPSRRRKALGQHFLANEAAADQIVEHFAPLPGDPVLEIGPGRGVLTGRLLAAKAELVAIEKDRALAEELAGRFGGETNFHLEVADAREADLEALVRPWLPQGDTGAKSRVLANLPYSAGTEILGRLLTRPRLFSSLTLMLQREVAERICASPGGRLYGSLSVFSQYFTEPKIVMRLTPGSFRPPPKVHSALVLMPFRAERELERPLEEKYPPFVRSLFSSRRRTLPHNLVPAWGKDIHAIAKRLRSLGIDPGRRPETLTRTECLTLFLMTPPPA